MASQAIKLLERLISTPSVSRDESGTADIIESYLSDCGFAVNRLYNNVWVQSSEFTPERPTLLLNSHHDTVKPSPAYTNDPFVPVRSDGKIFGLGSNDAGASVVSLIETFRLLGREPIGVNLLLAITAEEEVSGEKGVRALLPHLKERGIDIDMALVGEPTGMQPAIAERGLVVLDCVAHGVTGHAARNEGVNALYKAVDDIEILRNLKFDKTSAVLGDMKISVTQINAGRQHNVVPERCDFVVDVRTTDAYTNEQVVDMIRRAVTSDVTPRSTRIRASVIDESHPLVVAAKALGGIPYVSPTMSDMALMPDFPSLKMGPGESSRSHTADEYVYEHEIVEAIEIYKKLIIAL